MEAEIVMLKRRKNAKWEARVMLWSKPLLYTAFNQMFQNFSDEVDHAPNLRQENILKLAMSGYFGSGTYKHKVSREIALAWMAKGFAK